MSTLFKIFLKILYFAVIIGKSNEKIDVWILLFSKILRQCEALI